MSYLVVIGVAHVLESGRQAGLHALGLTDKRLHRRKLFVVSLQQFGHAVIQTVQIILKVGDPLGRIVALIHQNAIGAQHFGQQIDAVIGHAIRVGAGRDVVRAVVIVQHGDHIGVAAA